MSAFDYGTPKLSFTSTCPLTFAKRGSWLDELRAVRRASSSSRTPSRCRDIGLFPLRRRARTARRYNGEFGQKWMRGRLLCADWRGSVREEVDEGSCGAGLVTIRVHRQELHQTRGLPALLVGSNRDAPLSPEACRRTVLTQEGSYQRLQTRPPLHVDLYRNTATALLGSTTGAQLQPHLRWSDAQFERLGEALTLLRRARDAGGGVQKSIPSDASAAAVVAGLASCTSLKTLDLYGAP